MSQQIFYNSSLPRSGSTLLQNVFNQNPKIYATPTSGVVQFLELIRMTFSQAEFKAQDSKLEAVGRFAEKSALPTTGDGKQ